MQPELPLNIDSTMIVCARGCLQKFYNEFVLGCRPPGLSIDLHAGACFATALEETYRGHWQMGLSLDKALLRAQAAFFQQWGEFIIPEYKKTAKTADRMWQAVSNPEGDEQNRGYFDVYPPQTDEILPYFAADGRPTLEYTFAIPLEPATHPLQHNHLDIQYTAGKFPLHPSGEPFIYSGRFDKLGQRQGRPIVCDEKTSGRTAGVDWAKTWQLRNQFMGYCVSGDTEVLTRNGWLQFSSLDNSTEIAQWDNGNISFVIPSKVHRPHFKGNLTSVEGRISLLATPDHRQIILDKYDGRYKTFHMKDFPWSRGSARFITSGYKTDEGQDINLDFLKLLVAIQADGRFAPDSNGVRFSFSKERKMIRLATILNSLKIEATETHAEDGVTHFYLPAKNPWVLASKTYLGEEKNFGSWLLTLSGQALEIFIEELKFWDGSDYGSKTLYSTSNKNNADWVVLVAHLCNRYASVHLQDTCHRVVISKEIYKSILRHDVKEVAWDAPVYCVTVPSSHFLIRYKGKILVTGNCWACRQCGIDVDSVAVRGISVLKEKIGHAESIQPYSDFMISRWHEQLRRDLWRIRRAWDEGYWDYNFGDTCTSYGNCIFLDACASSAPENWLSTMEIRRWNPLVKNPVEAKDLANARAF